MTSRSSHRRSSAAGALLLLLAACGRDEPAPPRPSAPEAQEEVSVRSLYRDSLSDQVPAAAKRTRLTEVLEREPGLSPETRELLAGISFEVAAVEDPPGLRGGRAALGVLQALQTGAALSRPDESRRETVYELYRLVARRFEYGWFQSAADASLSSRSTGVGVRTDSRSMPPTLPRFTPEDLERLADLLLAIGADDWAARVLGWWIGSTGLDGLLSPRAAPAWRRLAALETGPAGELDALFYRAAAGDDAAPIEDAATRAAPRAPTRAETVEIFRLLLDFGLPWEAARFLDDVAERWGVRRPDLRRRAEESWREEFAGRAGSFVLPWFVAGVRIEEGMTLSDFDARLGRRGPRFESGAESGEGG